MDPATLANFANMAKQPGFTPELLQQLLNPRDPMGAITKFMPLGDKGLLAPLIEKIDLLKYGADIAQSAVSHGKHEIVELLVSKGVDLMSPPERVQEAPGYRRSPYVLQAAAGGDVATLELVLDNGGSIADAGFICLSTKRKNHVASNVVGAAAYAGKRKLLEYVLKRVGKEYLEVPAQETPDRENNTLTSTKSAPAFVKEFAGFTPLMLAVAKSDENFDCLQALLAQGANFNCKDEYENNLLHVAARYGNNKILDYLAKNLKLDVFARNSNGETALNICHTAKNQAGVAVLEVLQQTCDSSKSTADSLLSELDREEEQAEKSKAQRKQKKWRTKINRLAKAEGITPEEVERRLEKAEELKEQEAIAARKAQEEKEKAELAEQQRQREELRRLREEEERLEAAEEERYRHERLEEERAAKLERQRAQEEKRAKLRAEQRQRTERENGKQPRRDNKSRQRQEDHDGAQAAGETEAKPSLRKERAKTPARNADADDQQPRQGRHQDSQAERVQRAASKSQRRDDATENALAAVLEPQTKVIYGLGGEMALQAATSKRAQQRLRKQMAKGAEEEKAHEEKLRLAAIEKEEAKKQAAEEQRRAEAAARKERQRQRESEKAEKRRAEADAKELEKATRASLQQKAKDDKTRAKEENDLVEEIRRSDKTLQDADRKAGPKQYREKENKRAGKKDAAEPAPALVYRAKAPAAKAEETVAKAEPVEEQKVAETPQGGDQPQPPAKGKKESKPRRERKEKPAKADEAKPEAPEAKKEQAPAATPAAEPSQPAAESHKSAHPKEKEVKHAPKAEHKEPKEPKHQATSKEVASLQHQLLAKEHEIGRLQKHLGRQEKKADDVNQENHQLKEQLKLSSDENQLKNTIAQLNEQLTKQQLLNRLQAQQILEFEQSLWQEVKHREEAEEKLHEVQNGQSAPNAGAESTDQELRVKSVEIRQLQQQIDQLQGKATAINRLGRPQLVDLQEDLEQSLRKVQIAMKNTATRK